MASSTASATDGGSNETGHERHSSYKPALGDVCREPLGPDTPDPVSWCEFFDSFVHASNVPWHFALSLLKSNARQTPLLA
mmetsp:Transcript_3676/g.14379  ORF Transcript_3676/g.14379 Transcript_3676/m.14379 type:complete len:80 (+) Transcript_3676:345-584(+)